MGSQKISVLHGTGRIALLFVATWLHGGCVTSDPNLSPDSLIGTEWLALEIDGTPTMNQSQSTISFDDATRVTGNGGCNRFFGTAKISGKTLELGSLGTTRMVCPEKIMDQEYRFLEALESVRRCRVDDAAGLLYLSNEQGEPVLRLGQNKSGVPH